MEAWEGASPQYATGVYMSAADVERVKREREESSAGKLFRLIPALSFFFFFF